MKFEIHFQYLFKAMYYECLFEDLHIKFNKKEEELDSATLEVDITPEQLKQLLNLFIDNKMYDFDVTSFPDYGKNTE